MKKIQSLLLILGFMAVSQLALAKNTAATELSHLLSQIKTYQADFKQTTFGNRENIALVTRGKMYLMHPGKFRWETSKPFKQVIIANGSTLWVYDIDLQQATKRQISTAKPTDPAALLTGNFNNLVRQYKITKLLHGWYQLQPRKKGGAFQLVRLQFHRGKLVAMMLDNRLGQTSQFLMTNVKVNRRLDPKLFIFTAPRGVTVLQQ